MIELRYNKDGKLEYRTGVGSEQINTVGHREPIWVTNWNKWKIVPSEEQSSVEKNATPTNLSLRTERITLEVTHDCGLNLRDWHCWRRENLPLNPHESVRVVSELDQIRESCDRVSREEGILTLSEEITSLNKEIWRITVEREAALRERDELKARVEGLIKQRDCLSKQLESVSTQVAVWRRLEIGEIIKETDQYCLFSGGKWFPANSSSVGLPHNESQCEYRRCESVLQPAKNWLTEEERMAIRWVTDIKPIGEEESRKHFSVLRKLLTRSSPPEVEKPKYKAGHSMRDGEWITALAAAGVKVKE